MLRWWNSTGYGVWTCTGKSVQCIAVSVRKCVILIWVLPHDGGRSADTSGRNEAMLMNTMEVLTLLMLVFIVLTYINDIKKWPLQTLRKFSGHLWLKNSGADRSSVAPSLCMDIIAHLSGFVKIWVRVCVDRLRIGASCLAVIEISCFSLNNNFQVQTIA